MASFQKGTMALRPVRLKSSSMKSSVTSQKYSWPGREQNQAIQVKDEVGVDEASLRMSDAKSENNWPKYHNRLGLLLPLPDLPRLEEVGQREELLYHYLVSYDVVWTSFSGISQTATNAKKSESGLLFAPQT